jgi:hypothetical protein
MLIEMPPILRTWLIFKNHYYRHWLNSQHQSHLLGLNNLNYNPTNFFWMSLTFWALVNEFLFQHLNMLKSPALNTWSIFLQHTLQLVLFYYRFTYLRVLKVLEWCLGSFYRKELNLLNDQNWLQNFVGLVVCRHLIVYDHNYIIVQFVDNYWRRLLRFDKRSLVLCMVV